MLQHTFRIGVLMGGKSAEREVSFNSGRTICDHIDIDRYEAVPIFQVASGELYILPWKFLHRGKTSDFEYRLEKEAKKISWDDLKSVIDFVYIALHGQYAEDGTVQGLLEVLGIPYLGSKVFASAVGMDKVFQKKLLQMHDIAVPKDIILTPSQIKSLSLEQILLNMEKANISFPCIIKPALEGSSLGISVVTDKKDLLRALQKASWQGVTREQSVLIEEKIEGTELTCIALEKEGSWNPLPCTEVIPEQGTFFHDYEQKYMPGRSTKITPARCSDEEMKLVQKICMRVADVCGFSTFFRIDVFLTKDRKVVVIDPNTLSGMGPASFLFHQAAEIGMGHTELINYLVNGELAAYNLLDGIIKYQKEKKQKKMTEMKKRVVVLFGGRTNEREVSLESGRNVCYKLSPSKYDVIPVFIDENMNLYHISPRLLVQNSTREIQQMVTNDMKLAWSSLPQKCDFVFIGLHGGEGENGAIQGTLEMLGLPYNGPGVLASSLCMDKYKTNSFLEKRGFVVPKSRLIKKEFWATHDKQAGEALLETLHFPLILKPHDDGCSTYVVKINNKEELDKELKNYFSTEKQAALVEEYIHGVELTCGVIGNKDVMALPPSQVVASGDILSVEEKFLPGAGENQTPAKLPDKAILLIQKTMERVYQEIGCQGYSRIDCFYQDEKTSPTKKERVIILEINTLPAMTPATCLFHQAAEIGIKPMEFVDKIVEFGFARGKKQNIQSEVKNVTQEGLLK